MICAGLVFSGCTEGPLEEGDETDDDQDVDVQPSLAVRKVKTITTVENEGEYEDQTVRSYTYDVDGRIIKVVESVECSGTANDRISTYDLTYQDDCVIIVGKLPIVLIRIFRNL